MTMMMMMKMICCCSYSLVSLFDFFFIFACRRRRRRVSFVSVVVSSCRPYLTTLHGLLAAAACYRTYLTCTYHQPVAVATTTMVPGWYGTSMLTV